ncbi:hypothetical protein KTS45_10910 [Halomicroarcula limicola]|uniref:DUF7344 domain-containing protein n=1 Tax=Haloarcula limicola TaxID=1429915 RepID=A0A8J7YA82_9EURY|nr:hypothetical protein [Halomicroarcula limicola]MBV0924708.1 hypothetical protein [Halomicroarcula limicola]
MSEIESIDWDGVFRSLANSKRREILNFVTREQGATTDIDIARHLANDARDETVERTRIYLHHLHLPKLDESGLVVWNRDRGTVEETALTYQLPHGALVSAPGTASRRAENQQAND